MVVAELQQDHTLAHTKGGFLATTERVTVTLPAELLKGIDRLERNRSRFIAQAVEHELQRRRRDGLLESLKAPHPESAELADAGLADWVEDEPEALVDLSAGLPVRWIQGVGWEQGEK